MKKIPTLFQRNYDTDRLVRDEITPGCEWVANGEGIATRKWDGTCCLVRDGRLYKRHEVKKGKMPPANFEPAQDPEVRAWFDSLTPPNPVRPKPLVASVDCMQARSRKDDPCGVDAKLHEEGDRVDVVARKRHVAEVGDVVRRIAAEDRKPWWKVW